MKLKYIMCEGVCISQRTPYTLVNLERLALLGLNVESPVRLLDPSEFISKEQDYKIEFLELEKSLKIGDMVRMTGKSYRAKGKDVGLVISVKKCSLDGYYGEYSNSIEVTWLSSKQKTSVSESMLIKDGAK